MYVQGDDWVYSKKITSSETIDVNTIKSGADLSYCKIWLETTVDNVTYAKESIKDYIGNWICTFWNKIKHKEGCRAKNI